MKRIALDFLNRFLEPANMRIETLTRERTETRRLSALAEKGQFEKPMYDAFRPELLMESSPLLEPITAQENVFSKFCATNLNDVDYSFDNSYFSSPDTEVLYTLIGSNRPKRMVEMGSGNSTRVMRQAILDYKLYTKIVAIGPHPRVEVTQYADEVRGFRVQELDAEEIAGGLEPNDILFIDSSHLIGIGNDVPFLYFEVLPELKPGVLIHIQDIFLPYEYPREWIVDYKWGLNEQILLNAILT